MLNFDRADGARAPSPNPRLLLLCPTLPRWRSPNDDRYREGAPLPSIRGNIRPNQLASVHPTDASQGGVEVPRSRFRLGLLSRSSRHCFQLGGKQQTEFTCSATTIRPSPPWKADQPGARLVLTAGYKCVSRQRGVVSKMGCGPAPVGPRLERARKPIRGRDRQNLRPTWDGDVR